MNEFNCQPYLFNPTYSTWWNVILHTVLLYGLQDVVTMPWTAIDSCMMQANLIKQIKHDLKQTSYFQTRCTATDKKSFSHQGLSDMHIYHIANFTPMYTTFILRNVTFVYVSFD